MERRSGVYFSHERIVHFALREGDGFEAKRGSFRGRWRRESRDVAEGYEGESHLTMGIDVQQAIDTGIHKAAHHTGRQTEGAGNGEQVGEQSAVVPAEMTVGAGLIFPGVAPVGAGANDTKRGVGDGGFTASGFEEDAAIISGSQAAQAELGRGEVIDASIQVSEAPANEIELDFVERSSAGGGAKVDFAAGMAPLAGDAGGEIEELGHSFQIRRCIGMGGDAFGDAGEGSDAGLPHFAGQAHRLERRINLERERLIGPVHEMGVSADAGVGMFGGVVIGPSGREIAVVRHVGGGPSSKSK